jgi:hypothetical protein
MKIPLVSLVLILAFASLSFAQNPFVYSQSPDLKGLKKVYIDTGLDVESRKDIIKDLEDSKLEFEIMDRIEDAEILLGFGSGKVIERLTGSLDGDSIVLQDPSSRTDVGIVIVHIRGKDQFVQLFSSAPESGGPTGFFKDKPVTNFMREFVRIYKKANDLE